ncbi:MAG TPA: NAD(P)H-dependent oxidoreductase [Steroidobacteraceae bacterium]|jgi:NAD(P)H-dependent FMN reductase|nr:NAD(P)H-dependent oxidoreductase [Steroidobacteraceae bacterium]
MTPKILAFAGSTRTQSWNKKLVHLAAASARAAGAEVTLVDLRDVPMPLYDGDLEASGGLPDGAQALKRLMVEHDGFLISAPEYNSSISAVLKNAIDWVSRPRPNEPSGVAFRGKVAALLAASPGNLGGIRGLLTVRQVLNTLGVLVLPTQFGLARANEAFADDGGLKDPAQQKSVAAVAQELVTTIARLKG